MLSCNLSRDCLSALTPRSGKEGKKEEGEYKKRRRGMEGWMLKLLRSCWRGNMVLTKCSSINVRQRERDFLEMLPGGWQERKKGRKMEKGSQR